MINTRNEGLRRITNVLAEAETGTFTLPERVVELQAVRSHIEQQIATLERPNPGSAEDELRRQIRQAGDTRAPLPSAAVVWETTAAAFNAEALITTAQAVVDDLDSELYSEIASRSTEIIVEHMRPVHTRIVTEARKQLKALGSAPLDPAVLLIANDKVRAAGIAFTSLAGEYDHIRDVASLFVRHVAPPRLDTNGRLAESPQMGELWPRPHQSAAPWPTDSPAERFRWLLTNDVTLWLPTGPERDEAFTTAFPQAPVFRDSLVG